MKQNKQSGVCTCATIELKEQWSEKPCQMVFFFAKLTQKWRSINEDKSGGTEEFRFP